MRILIVGATGTIGRAVASALAAGSEIIGVSRKSAGVSVDISDPASVKAMYGRVGKLDAVVCAAGSAKFSPLGQLSDADFRFCLDNKLMGQVNVVRFGLEHVSDGGSFTVTSGILARSPMPGSGAISLVNAGLEGFVRAAALEAPRRIRVNVVSPPWVTETLRALKMDPSQGLPAAVVARAYVRSVTGTESGLTLEPASWSERLD
ncbi:MAG TPA: short chain dehydrogenase [Burkholderiaceae bacterium]|nr:short chain dehydrogenase [Burkholderiaceae bacterium]